MKRLPILISPDDERRLQILNDSKFGRSWSSCQEKRRCIRCERVFSGTQVEIRRHRRSSIRVACPGCGSEPRLWVRRGNPLTDESIWADWELAIEHYTDDLAAAS